MPVTRLGCTPRSTSRCTRRRDGRGCSARRPRAGLRWPRWPRPASAPDESSPSAGVAAAGLAARTVAGHLSESALGGVAVAVHTRWPRRCGAARWRRWCSPSTTADSGPGCCRGSRRCRCCVWRRCWPAASLGAVVTPGLAGAAVRHGIRPAVVREDRGHGGAHRPGVAQPHGVATGGQRRTAPRAVVSRSRSLIELAIMAVALTLAAALAVTG